MGEYEREPLETNGYNHLIYPAHAILLKNAATLDEATGRYCDAEMKYLECYELLLSRFDEGHPHLRIGLDNIQAFYEEYGHRMVAKKAGGANPE